MHGTQAKSADSRTSILTRWLRASTYTQVKTSQNTRFRQSTQAQARCSKWPRCKAAKPPPKLLGQPQEHSFLPQFDGRDGSLAFGRGRLADYDVEVLTKGTIMIQRAQQGREKIGRYHLRVRNKELLETVDLRAGGVKTGAQELLKRAI